MYILTGLTDVDGRRIRWLPPEQPTSERLGGGATTEHPNPPQHPPSVDVYTGQKVGTSRCVGAV